MAEPVRKCAGCGRKGSKKTFVRVCRLPDKSVVFDPQQEREGRSLYFCPSRDCFEKLMRRRAPEKLLKEKLPDDCRDAINGYLSRTESAT